MARKPHFGKCRLCEAEGKLSFEHVPPEAAFNKRRVRVLSGDEALKADLENLPKGREQQRGAGAYTLCERCNSTTGAWYGRDFAHWTYQAAEVLRRSGGIAAPYCPYQIYPLRVLKQVVCMFFSANTEQLADAHPELVRFVLNRESYGLPSRYRFFAFLNNSNRMRSVGFSGIVKLGSRQTTVLSEITFPPLGYVLCLDSHPPDSRLTEITFFSGYLIDDLRTVELRAHVLPVFTHFPGDYRDKDTVLQERDENRRAAPSVKPR